MEVTHDPSTGRNTNDLINGPALTREDEEFLDAFGSCIQNAPLHVIDFTNIC